MASEADKLNRRVLRQIDATDAQIEAFIQRLTRFLDISLEEILADVETGEVRGLEAVRRLAGIQSALEQLGLNEELGRLRVIYAKELQFISDEFAEMDITRTFSDADRTLIETLINFDFESFQNRIQDHVLDIRSQVTRQVLSGQGVDLKAVRAELGDRFDSNIKTELRTATSTFNRTVRASKAEELGLDLFIYRGPLDKITRDFCQGVLTDRNPPIYTLDEINGMDNGQGLDVLTSGGGYNCRHQWIAITEERARKLGYDG